MEPYLTDISLDGIFLFTLNNPEKRNAMNYEMMDALENAIETCKNDQAVKAFVITGAGEEAFCSGGDLSIFKNLITEEDAFYMLSKMSRILFKLLTLPKPTVACLNGVALGGGCELASACDFRLAKKDGKAGFVQGKLGITTGWGGGSIILEKLIPANALKMLLEAKIHSVEELQQFGFIDAIYEGDKIIQLTSFLERISSLDGEVLTAYKLMLIRKWESTDLEDRMLQEVKQCSKLWAKDSHHQKVNDFFNRK